MRTLLAFLFLTATALAQYSVTNFGGPWLPGVHGIAMPPNGFTYSENFFSEPGGENITGYRVQRRGLTKALASSLGAAPILAVKEFWHEGDSLAVVFFQGGNWYYSNYAKVTYGKSNWYDGGAYDNRTYDANYTLNTPTLIRPYSSGQLDFYDAGDSVTADNENASLFYRFFAPGDTVQLDTDKSGTWDYKFVVKRIESNRRLIADTLIADIDATRANCWYRIQRPFSSTSIADVEIYDKRAYVTNGIQPMQLFFWWDSTTAGQQRSGLFMREVHTADRVPINDIQGWFYDTANSWVSPEDAGDFGGGSAKVDSFNLRFTRVYSWGKGWEPGEWSGALNVGPTDLYFFKFPGPPDGNGSPDSTHQNGIRIVPVFYNDENSLVLLNPLLGQRDSIYRDIAAFTNYYPFQPDNDSTTYHDGLEAFLVGHEGYLLSMAGNLEVVLPREVTGSIKALGNASLWISEDQQVRDSVPAGQVRFNQYIYFIHSFNPEQNQNRTIATEQTYSYKYFDWNFIPSPLPEGWQIVSYEAQKPNGQGGVSYYPFPQSEIDKTGGVLFGNGRVQVKIPNVDTAEIAISAREFYHVRFAVGSSGGDSVVFITSNQPASNGVTGSIDTVTVTDWELVRAEVPRFAGIEAHPRIGLVGWGDTTDQGIVSRSALTQRGGEPENWSPAHDVRVVDEQDPIVAIESANDFETIFTTEQIFGAALTSSGLWTYEELTKNVGCWAPRSIVALNDRIYFRGNDAFYVIRRRDLAGFEIVSISDQIRPVLNSMDLSANFGHDGSHIYENRSRVGLELGIWDERADRIWWFMAMGSSNVPNYALTYNPGNGVWDGVHSIGAAAGTAFLLRDTMQMLITDPNDKGMACWANVGVGDTGIKISTVLESTMYGVHDDTTRIHPERMTLTYSSDAALPPGTDSMFWIMAGLSAQEFVAAIDTAVRSPASAYGLYTAVDRFLFDDTPGPGAAVLWRWKLVHKGDTTSTVRRFQPLRMTVDFSASGTGD